MVTAGDRVIIDHTHELFGGRQGVVRGIEHRFPKDEYLVIIENSATLYEFTAEELLVP